MGIRLEAAQEMNHLAICSRGPIRSASARSAQSGLLGEGRSAFPGHRTRRLIRSPGACGRIDSGERRGEGAGFGAVAKPLKVDPVELFTRLARAS